MPTYDYKCTACGHRLEHFASFSEAPLRRCPKCRKDTLERLIGSGAGILFKGSGFYETDYKRASPSGAGKDTSSSKDKGDSKPSGDGKDSAGAKPVEKPADKPSGKSPGGDVKKAPAPKDGKSS